MSRSFFIRLFAFSAAPLALTATALFASGQKLPVPQAESEKLAKAAFAVLKQNCFACHSGAKPMGGLSLTKREDVLKGGDSGPSVVPASPEQSLLLRAVNYDGRKMPPSGQIPKGERDTLRQWVKAGLPWPNVKEAVVTHTGPPPVNAETKKFWAFQPVKRGAVPKVKNAAWVKNPIDAFILNGLEKAKLTPNPSASKIALLRRASYDLTGLPPTPQEVTAFLADKSPNAYEKVVDRLLASPHYGEKWGRHWLDLVRYAETNSYERDGPKPNAWRYRDYVIQSFNADKPYNQFVTEQLAGDELPERTPEKLIATGYYRLGLWDDEPADPEQALYDDLDDISSTTGQVFLGLTVGCARCHDHKIDPIPQKDYYRFLSFFAGVTRFGDRSRDSIFAASERPIVPPEEVARYKAEFREHETKIRTADRSLAEIEQKVYKDFQPVEKEDFRDEGRRLDIMKKRVPASLSQAEFDRYAALTTERNHLRETPPKQLEMALSVTELPQPRPMNLLLRGNPHVPGDKVEPGFPSVLSPPEPQITPAVQNETSGRRLALANWIVSPQNPLSARVMVNRIWQHHFGRGLVRTSSNFGFQGTKPTHPELLDWLASEFVRNGWKMKPLHKLIMLSSTYRLSAQSQPKALAKDPENDHFWRFDMRRLLAEEVRDSILLANGSLNPRMGGPSVYPEMPEAVLAGQSMPGAGWGHSTPEEQCRRSVYVYSKRSLALPMIASFDGPETDFTCPIRFATTQPTQALGMLNSEFIAKEARKFADLLKTQKGGDTPAQVRLALWRVMQRPPTPKEIARGVKLIADLQKQHGMTADDALKNFCVVALNLNEFLYLD